MYSLQMEAAERYSTCSYLCQEPPGVSGKDLATHVREILYLCYKLMIFKSDEKKPNV